MTPAGHFLQLKHICIPHQILVHRSGAGAALGNAPDHQALASAAVTGGKNAFRGGHVVLGDQIAPVVPRKTKGLCHIALAAHKPRGNQPPVFGDIVPGRGAGRSCPAWPNRSRSGRSRAAPCPYPLPCRGTAWFPPGPASGPRCPGWC